MKNIITKTGSVFKIVCGNASRLLRIALLRFSGVRISWSANVCWDAEIKKMGGSIEIGDGTSIDKGVILRAYGGFISIGKNCSVNPYCVLYGHGGLQIQDYVRIATHSVFIPANHIYHNRDVKIYLQGEKMHGIKVEEDVWIATGVRVLDNVTIGKGSVVAAGAVVTKSLAPYGVYAGIPAKKISERGSE